MAVRDADAIAVAAVHLWGADAARGTTGADRLGDVTPRIVLEPPDAVTLAAMLRWADSERLAVVPRGGGTKLTWGSPPARLDALLSLSRLNQPIDHCAGDLTATVPAGAPLGAVNDRLTREGQWLPLDPPHGDRATIGGVVATNDSGPRRQRHGTPHDLIIGVEMALADGRIAKAGGRVVKNVAGYDLGRLLCGSFGSLAIITRATFKLSPVPAASRTVVALVKTARQLNTLALALVAAPLNPSAMEIDWPPGRLLIRFETTTKAAEQQAAAVCDLCGRHDATATVVQGEAEAATWRAYEASVWQHPGMLIKIGVLPTDVGGVLEQIAQIAADHRVEYRVGGRVALGVLYVRLEDTVRLKPDPTDDTYSTDKVRLKPDPTDDTVMRPPGSGGVGLQPDHSALAAILTAIRGYVQQRRGSAVLLAAPAAVRSRVNPWGDIGDGFPIMRAVKARFDPVGTLAPGRGPGGL